MSGTGRRGDAGFTLIELLVTLGIMALVSSVLFPKVEQLMRFSEWRGATDGVAATLAQGRADALRWSAPVSFQASADGSRYRLSDAKIVTLPADARVALARAPRIIFYRDGSATGGVVRVAGAGRQALFVVSPDTGLVRRVD